VSKNKNRKKPAAAFAPTLAKHPTFGGTPSEARRVPAVGQIPSINDQAPSWRIARIEMEDPFGWHLVGHGLLHDIRIKLAQFEAKTWNEILVKEKHWNHTIPVSKLCAPARERLTSLHIDDIEEIVSLRLTGPQRVLGYRVGPVFHVLWWDPEHKICPSELRHT
jgi:hypothetical protein